MIETFARAVKRVRTLTQIDCTSNGLLYAL